MPDSVGVAQQVWLQCSLGGLTLTNAFAARINASASRRYTTATMYLHGIPAYLGDLQTPLDREGLIYCGAGGGTGPNDQLRYRGRYKTYDTELWPNVAQLQFVGTLFDASRTFNPDLATPDPANSIPGKLATDLIEVTNAWLGTPDADGASDEDMIRYLLTVSGVPFEDGNIGGTGRLFGTGVLVTTDATGQPTGPFIWPAGTSALSMIEQIDQVSVHADGERAFKTIESLAGVVYRVATGGRPREAFDVPQFTQGVDVKVAQGGGSILNLGNYAIVVGYTPPGGLPAFTELESSNAYQSSDRHYLPSEGQVNLQMIEFETEAEADGNGMSTELYAQYVMGQINRVPKNLTLTTPRDDLIGPLQTHGVLLPALSLTEPMLCQEVTIAVNEQAGSWLQHLTEIAGGSESGSAPPL
jgi:hypothetical protein